MKIRLMIPVLLLSFCVSVQAQSRADLGLHVAGDKDSGYKNTAVGLAGRIVLDLKVITIDGGGEWVFRAPKIGENVTGQTLFVDVLVRRRVLGPIYAVAGIDVNQLSSLLLDTTITSAATGAGIIIGAIRFQGLLEPPDFTSDRSVSKYRFELEYTRALDKSYFISFKPQTTVRRFDSPSGSSILTATRFGLTISVGRFFSQ